MRSRRKLKKWYRRFKRVVRRTRVRRQRRPYRRRSYRSKARKITIRHWPLNWPDAMLAKLPYSEKYRFGASPGASGYTFNLNDPNDPWQGIGNPSATNFQLLGSYYKWCTVYGVKVSCTYYQRSISGGLIQQGVYMFMIPYTNYTPVPAVDDDIFTTRWVSYKMVGNTNTRVYR